MRNIKLVSNTIFTTPDAPEQFLGGTNFGFRQGSLDGACGPYAVMAAMVAGGLISRHAAISAWNSTPDGRTKFAKAIKEIPALVQEGTDSSQLIELIKAIEHHTAGQTTLSPYVLCNEDSTIVKGRTLIPLIKDALTSTDMPVILELDWEGSGSHWVVAIGYEDSDTELVDHLLIVDPGFDLAPVQLWNGILSCHPAKKGPKPYKYWVDNHRSDSFCQISGAIALN